MTSDFEVLLGEVTAMSLDPSRNPVDLWILKAQIEQAEEIGSITASQRDSLAELLQ